METILFMLCTDWVIGPGNHVEDNLSLPAASSLGRRKYPPPSIHPSAGIKPAPAPSRREALAVRAKLRIPFFLSSKNKGV
jgi:hypothetical protein